MSQGEDSPAAAPEEEPARADHDAEAGVEDDSTDAAASKAASICKQVDYYFSDANLPTDEYMLTRIRRNKQGWGAPASV